MTLILVVTASAEDDGLLQRVAESALGLAPVERRSIKGGLVQYAYEVDDRTAEHCVELLDQALPGDHAVGVYPIDRGPARRGVASA